MKYSWRCIRESVAFLGLSLAVVLGVIGCGGGGDGEDSGDNGTLPTGARYALAIGIDHYAPGYASSLPSCINDANGFSAELRRDSSLWNRNNITVMTDSAARLASIRSKMQELAGAAQSGDLVVYFHSSHGGDSGTSDTTSDSVPDATFLCAYDTEYEDEMFAQDLARFADGVKIVVVIDACFAAGMYKGGQVFAFPERVMSRLASNCKAMAVKGPSVGWLASSDYTETSAAGPTYSRFTQYLIEAFRNGDANSSGNLTFKELFDYAKPRTQPTHNPQIYNSALLGSLVAAAVDPNAPSDGSDGDGTPTTTYIAPATLSAGYALQMFGRYGLMNTYVINSSTELTEIAGSRYGQDETYTYTYTRRGETRATLVIRTGTNSDMYWDLTFLSSSGGLQENGTIRTYRDGLLVDTTGVWAGLMTYAPRP